MVKHCFGNTHHTEVDTEIKGIKRRRWVILTGAVKMFTAFSRNFDHDVKVQPSIVRVSVYESA